MPILRFLGWRKERERKKERKKGEKERKEQPSRSTLIARVEKKIQRWKRRSRCEFHSISRLLTIERARSSLYIRRLYPGNVFSTRSCGIAEREREKEKILVLFLSLSISGTGLIARRIVVKDFRLRFVAVFHSPFSLFSFFFFETFNVYRRPCISHSPFYVFFSEKETRGRDPLLPTRSL